jgi:hypothetical protein
MINIGNVVSGSSSLPSGMNSTYCYLRATGFLIPSVTGLYTIGVNASDGVNLFVGQQAIVADLAGTDTANSSAAYTQSGTIMLTAGVYYELTLEWQHAGGTNYEVQLLWTPPASSVAVIPSANLSNSNNSVSSSLAVVGYNGTAGLWYPGGVGIIDFASTVQLNKNIDNVADGSTYNRTTVNQVTGAGRAFSALDANNQVASQLNAKPLYAIQTFSAGNPLSQSGSTKTITVAASTIVWGSNSVSYSSGSVTPLAYGLKYVYADDPTFAGGAVTYVATISQLVLYQSDGRVSFGSITTASGGGGVGGGGSCFSPNTKIKTQRGDVSFWDIKEGDLALTARGTWRPIVQVRCSQQTDRPILDMGNDELVTLGHLFKSERWTPANELGRFAASASYTGLVANLCIEAEDDDDGSALITEHSYTLANGYIVHNMPQGTQ